MKFSVEISITKILREIDFGDSKSAKTAVFAILGALNFVHLVNISLSKVQKFMKIKIQNLLMCKKADFALLETPKLISLKI